MNDRHGAGNAPQEGTQHLAHLTSRSSRVARRPKALPWGSGRARLVESWGTEGPPGAAPEGLHEEYLGWAAQVSADWLEQQKRAGAVDYHIVGHVWLMQRLLSAARDLTQLITLDPAVRGGVPVLTGTRLPLARIFAEVAENRPLSEIAEDLELPAESLMQVFRALAGSLERPYAR